LIPAAIAAIQAGIPRLFRGIVTPDQEFSQNPPGTRSLRTIQGARMELARLYRQTEMGEIEPQLAGRLAHILGLLISSHREHTLDDRLSELETRLARIQPNSHPRVNGAAAHR
jgi:hypothetical protein